jgi:glycosyltransferase involved in cell wall biosynthesis
MTPTPILCAWTLSSLSGWGVYGLNLAQHWALDPEVRPIFRNVGDGYQIDPLRAARLQGIVNDSKEIDRILASGRDITLPGIAIDALRNGLHANEITRRIKANTHVGAVFFENTKLDADARARAAKYELIITGSSWNDEILRRNDIGPTACVLQGVDTTLFHPAPRTGLFDDRFLVFSGGKLEPRKGQDLVLKAFKLFAARHPDAVLVTAWHSPWPQFAAAFGGDGDMAPVKFAKDGRIEPVRWAVDNGLQETQVFDVGQVANWLMPMVLREMHAALFMNRGEGGTNLVAMECMACGVPTILSANTGHLDLLRGGAARALKKQTMPAVPAGMRDEIEGWGDSDVEEAASALEAIYDDRAAAAETGRQGAAMLAGMSWARQTALLKDVLRPFFASAR